MLLLIQNLKKLDVHFVFEACMNILEYFYFNFLFSSVTYSYVNILWLPMDSLDVQRVLYYKVYTVSSKMVVLWGLLKINGCLFWACFCFPTVVLCISCTPLLKNQQNIIWEKSQVDSCKPFFLSPGAIFLGKLYCTMYYVGEAGREVWE